MDRVTLLDVICSRCSEAIDRANTLFDAHGELICRRCHSFEEAHAQVDRARASRQGEIDRAGGALGQVDGIVARIATEVMEHRADVDARDDHATLAAMQPISNRVRCTRCGAFYRPRKRDEGACAACTAAVRSANRVLTIAVIVGVVVLPLGTCAVANALSETTLVILSVFDIVFLMYVLRAFIRAHTS